MSGLTNETGVKGEHNGKFLYMFDSRNKTK